MTKKVLIKERMCSGCLSILGPWNQDGVCMKCRSARERKDNKMQYQKRGRNEKSTD